MKRILSILLALLAALASLSAYSLTYGTFPSDFQNPVVYNYIQDGLFSYSSRSQNNAYSCLQAAGLFVGDLERTGEISFLVSPGSDGYAFTSSQGEPVPFVVEAFIYYGKRNDYSESGSGIVSNRPYLVDQSLAQGSGNWGVRTCTGDASHNFTWVRDGARVKIVCKNSPNPNYNPYSWFWGGNPYDYYSFKIELLFILPENARIDDSYSAAVNVTVSDGTDTQTIPFIINGRNTGNDVNYEFYQFNVEPNDHARLYQMDEASAVEDWTTVGTVEFEYATQKNPTNNQSEALPYAIVLSASPLYNSMDKFSFVKDNDSSVSIPFLVRMTGTDTSQNYLSYGDEVVSTSPSSGIDGTESVDGIGSSQRRFVRVPRKYFLTPKLFSQDNRYKARYYYKGDIAIKLDLDAPIQGGNTQLAGSYSSNIYVTLVKR